MKISIIIPYSSTSWGVSPSWALALQQLIIPGRYNIHIIRGLPIDVARNHGIEHAFKENADWIFFLDSDIILPPNALVMLLQWKLPIVAGIYPLKRIEDGFKLNVYKKEGNSYKQMTLEDVPKGHRLLECDAVATGILLVSCDLLRKISKPYFKWDIYPESEEEGVSEDIFFSEKVKKELGIEIYADTFVRGKHQIGSGVAVTVEGRLTNIL